MTTVDESRGISGNARSNIFGDLKYIKLLESGGSKNYKDLLKPFNLNPSRPDFWSKGLKVIESFINQIEDIK